MRLPAGAVAAAVLALGLGCCDVQTGTGYIDIKTIPPSAAPALYLDTAKLEPLRNGNALLRQRVGLAQLQTDDSGHLSVLCTIEVKKNRITSVTVSALGRPRCQCARPKGSDAARTCVG